MHFISKILAALLCILLAASPAGAGSMTLLGAGKAGGGGLPGPPTLTFIGGSTIAQSNTNTITSTATVNIGTASATRRVIVVVILGGFMSGASITSATIDGGAGGGPLATAVAYDVSESGSGVWTAQISAVVPTGTTGATISITTTSGGIFGTAFYEVYTTDNSQLASTTPASGTNSSASANSLAASASPANSSGFIVGSTTLQSGSSALAASGYTTDAFGGTAFALVFSKTNVSSGLNTATSTWTTATPSVTGIAAWR